MTSAIGSSTRVIGPAIQNTPINASTTPGRKNSVYAASSQGNRRFHQMNIVDSRRASRICGYRRNASIKPRAQRWR